MSSVNKTILIGRVGKDPEVKQVGSGSLTTLSLATHEVWRNKQGEKQEDLQWHNIVIWGKQAENVARYVNKGDQLYIEGKIQTDSYEKDGVKRWTTKIVAREVKFLTPKGQPQQQQSQPQQQQYQQNNQQQYNNNFPPQIPQKQWQQQPQNDLDNIPF